MSLALMSLILLGGLILLLAIGVEIAPAMGLVAAFGMIVFVGHPLDYFPRAAFEIMNNFTFTAIPLFVFMGAIFSNTGIIGNLFKGAEKIFGNLPGSMASSVIVANAIFGAISGSSLAAVATFGKICFPEMEKSGYDVKLSLGAIAISGTLSVLIPPSVILIVYAGWQDVSVARLFAGGIVPGIILASLFVLTITIRVILNRKLAPPVASASFGERLTAIIDLLPFLFIIFLVLGQRGRRRGRTERRALRGVSLQARTPRPPPGKAQAKSECERNRLSRAWRPRGGTGRRLCSRRGGGS